jgi:hypothetical protein
MRKQIYRVRLIGNRRGRFWVAEPYPGYNPLSFPVILGATTLEQCLARVKVHLERWK